MPQRSIPVGTIVTTATLFVSSVFFYFLSTWTTINAVRSARQLATVAEKVIRNQGNDTAVQDALLIELPKLEHRDDLAEMCLHMSIALFVAVVIIIAVEIHSSRRMETETEASRTRVETEAKASQARIEAEAEASRFRSENEIKNYRDMIARNVFQAIYQRLIPPEVIAEIEQILQSAVVREGVSYTLRFFRYAGLSNDIIVVERRVSYTLKNITGREIKDFKIRATIVNPHEPITISAAGQSKVLPCHTRLTINDQPVELSNVVKGGLLEHVIDIPATASAAPSIVLLAEEPMRIRDTNAYTLMTPSKGLTVRIDNRLEHELEVTKVALQLPRDFHRLPNGDYHDSGGLLPGQTFTVSWEPVSSVQAVDGPASRNDGVENDVPQNA